MLWGAQHGEPGEGSGAGSSGSVSTNTRRRAEPAPPPRRGSSYCVNHGREGEQDGEGSHAQEGRHPPARGILELFGLE